MEPAQFGVVYSGMSSINFPFGDGLRCIAEPVVRYRIRAANGGGMITYGPGEIAAGNVQIDSGETWHLQGWYRDPAGPCGLGFNLTNGLSVTWQ